MQHFDTLIVGGLVVNADGQSVADIAISDGLIAAIGHDLGSADQVIEAAGKIVVPGGIDSHVHISQPSGDGNRHGRRFRQWHAVGHLWGHHHHSAFCLQQKGQSLREVLKDYHAKADGNCHADVSFHLIVTDPTPNVLGQELPALVEEGYTSFKVFMTYEGMRLYDNEILATMDTARDTGAPGHGALRE